MALEAINMFDLPTSANPLALTSCHSVPVNFFPLTSGLRFDIIACSD
jgi:hypothetical protein